MDLSLSTSAIKNLLSFPFCDPNWKKKILIGTGLYFAGMVIPVLPLVLVWGYFARLLRAGANNEDASRLPEWDDWNDLFVDGLRQFGVIMLFSFPLLLIWMACWVFLLPGLASMSFTELDSSGGGGLAAFSLLAVIIFTIIGFFGLLLLLVIWVLSPTAQTHVAVNRRFSAAFDYHVWWRVLRANIGGFVTGVVLLHLLNLILIYATQILMITLILCVFSPLIMFPGMFYSMVIAYRMFGQAYREGLTKASLPTTPAALEPPVESSSAA